MVERFGYEEDRRCHPNRVGGDKRPPVGMAAPRRVSRLAGHGRPRPVPVRVGRFDVQRRTLMEPPGHAGTSRGSPSGPSPPARRTTARARQTAMCHAAGAGCTMRRTFRASSARDPSPRSVLAPFPFGCAGTSAWRRGTNQCCLPINLSSEYTYIRTSWTSSKKRALPRF